MASEPSSRPVVCRVPLPRAALPFVRTDQRHSVRSSRFSRASRIFRTVASTVLTSNKGFEEWGHVLGDEIMAAALIDRLLHHCHIVNIRGNSYRMREHQHWLRTASDEQREGVAT